MITQEEIEIIIHWFKLFCKRNKINKPTKNIIDDFISTYSINIDTNILTSIKL